MKFLPALVLIIVCGAPVSAAEEKSYGSPDLLHAYMVMKKPFTKEACAAHAFELIKSAVGEIATKDDGGASASDDKFTIVISCAPPKTVFFIAAGPPKSTDEVPGILQRLMKDFQGPGCTSKSCQE
jgi:hypothetical protein